jgi:DNA invertase Pin-like site-specific DNA recombinase
MGRRVAIYARVSTEHEAQISALGNQIQYYDEKLKQHPDWTLVERYIDEGITGTSIHKRPNFLRMLKDAESGKFDLIVTREVSRFARNTVDTLQETRKLKKMGVEVYFTEDNIWTFKDDDGELKLTIMATLAQNESKKISQRVKAGQQITFQNGVFYGNGNILGYDKVGKDMVINEEQAKTVRLIFDLYLKGYGSKKIKYELEKLGRVTSTGLNRWSESYIIRVLRNSFYCGTIVYRKQFVPDYLEQKHKKNNGEVEQVIVEGRHTPIISKEVFEKVQEKLKDNAKLIVSSNTSRGIGNRGKKVFGVKN